MRGPLEGAPAAVRSGGLLKTALASVEGWLLEPLEHEEPAAQEPTSATPLDDRPVVAVVGLAPRSGATTVARALGAELAHRDPAGACAVSSSIAPAGIPLGLPAAGRLARALEYAAGGRARAVGRLGLVEGADDVSLVDAARYLAPLVLDVGEPGAAGGAASLADHVLLVVSPRVEPALADVVAASLGRVGPEPTVVLNRAAGDPRWEGRGDLALPESRMGAQLALGGREPRGALGRTIARLADLCVRPTR